MEPIAKCIMFSTFVLCKLCNSSFVHAAASTPRIVSDLDIIEGREGVSLDYRYNESGSEMSSVPGCPQSIDGYPWILYGKSPRCFLAGYQGPCGRSEVLMPQLGSTNGICVCYCLQHEEIRTKLSEAGRYLACSDDGPIFDKQEKRCYRQFKRNQGLCKNDTVIIDWTADSLDCHPICDRKIKSSRYWAAMAEQGLCSNGKGVPRPQSPPPGAASLPLFIPKHECQPGERYSKILKTCNKSRPIGPIG